MKVVYYKNLRGKKPEIMFSKIIPKNRTCEPVEKDVG